jgi:hypothetical protein
MTIINSAELADLSTLDQLLMWSIVSINASNLDRRNNYVNDSASIREESKDFISWSIVQDDNGLGKFVYSALLPLSNPNPLKDKESIFQQILSYSPFDPTLETEGAIPGWGWGIPTIPTWVTSTEQVLAYASTLATAISKLARLTRLDELSWTGIYPKYWANSQCSINDTPYGGTMVITGSLNIDWSKYINGQSLIKCLNPDDSVASDINCNFPNLMMLWGVGSVDPLMPIEQIQPLIPSIGVLIEGEDTAEGLINSYGGNYFLDEAVPDWFKDALDGYQDRSERFNNSSNDIGNATPKIIESLTICKEQDPEVISFSVSLADKVKV